MSRWLAIDPEATEKRRVPEQDDGLLIEFGFWPPSVENRLRACLREISFFQNASGTTAQAADLEKQYSRDDELLREAARWSVRGWDGEPGAVMESGEIGGRKFPKLSEKSLDLLSRNRMLYPAAIAATLFNINGPEKKSG